MANEYDLPIAKAAPPAATISPPHGRKLSFNTAKPTINCA
ncbi:MAG: hypothetical protein Rpha_1849 [Candidatus Ruthia sp. Apha_13_S6]|nr:hypothetical protein [Candidatus Ruthia sp. Apha_13_S6]